jgi:tetratricopeptide (TPR) repeat protein
MKPLGFLLFFSVTALLSPASASAQSPSTHRPSPSPSDVAVSVQELATPAKAARAFEKGTSLLLKGDAEASLSYFATVIELAPSSYRAHHNLGLAHYHLGQLDAAAQDFQTSIDLTGGSFVPSLFGLSMIFYQRSQFPDAESLIRKGLFLNPGSAIGKYCLGLVQYSRGQNAQALQNALDALTRDPALADVHVLLARIHERQHNPSAVIADVQAYFKLDPRGSLQDEARKLLARAELNLSPVAASLD